MSKKYLPEKEIRTYYNAGVGPTAIARHYGVSASRIRRLLGLDERVAQKDQAWQMKFSEEWTAVTTAILEACK